MQHMRGVIQYFKLILFPINQQYFLQIKNQKYKDYFFIFLIKKNKPPTSNLSILKKFSRETPLGLFRAG